MQTQNSIEPNRDAARESDALLASNRRLRDSREVIEAENAALDALLLKQTKFIRQLERFLTSAEKKREALDREKERVLHNVFGVRP